MHAALVASFQHFQHEHHACAWRQRPLCIVTCAVLAVFLSVLTLFAITKRRFLHVDLTRPVTSAAFRTLQQERQQLATQWAQQQLQWQQLAELDRHRTHERQAVLQQTGSQQVSQPPQLAAGVGSVIQPQQRSIWPPPEAAAPAMKLATAQPSLDPVESLSGWRSLGGGGSRGGGSLIQHDQQQPSGPGGINGGQLVTQQLLPQLGSFNFGHAWGAAGGPSLAHVAQPIAAQDSAAQFSAANSSAAAAIAATAAPAVASWGEGGQAARLPLPPPPRHLPSFDVAQLESLQAPSGLQHGTQLSSFDPAQLQASSCTAPVSGLCCTALPHLPILQV